MMAGDIKAKHVDCNSRLSTRLVKLLRDYTDENSYLIFRPDSPTTNTFNLSVTRDVLDIVITKLSFPVYPTSCSALNSDHLTTYRFSSKQRVAHPFTTHRTVLTSGALTGPTFRLI